MRALKYDNRKRILTTILACNWLVAAQVMCCFESVGADLEPGSITVADIQLPTIEGLPEQKPTSAIFVSPEIVPMTWHIASDILDASDQKTKQSRCVSADCISSPLGVELPPCDAPAVVVRVEPEVVESAALQPVPAAPVSSAANMNEVLTVEDGARKPALSTAPVPQEIVQVQWSIKPRSVDAQDEYRSSLQFQAGECPIVVWKSDRFEEIQESMSPIDETSEPGIELATVETDLARAQVASIERKVAPAVDQATLSELQSLTRISDAESDVTYFSELNQLLVGESNWLFADDELLDLAPEEGSDTGASYMDDLNTLVKERTASPHSSGYQNTFVPQPPAVESESEKALSSSKKTAKPYTSIAPDPKCTLGGGSGVSALFQSVSNIRLNGLSTDPPSRSREDVGLTAELPRPENLACQYLDMNSPAYYTTPVRYGSRRPSRDTHVFCHRPLYFEDANLERCGQANGCLTTACSVVHFATLIAFTPYTTLAEHPADCVRSLPDCPTCHRFE